MVSMVSFLFGGALSTICFCRSMNVEPLLANNLRRLITGSLLNSATARSACTRSYPYTFSALPLHISDRIQSQRKIPKARSSPFSLLTSDDAEMDAGEAMNLVQ
ncbi:hypothetical protein CJ030_MR2G024704 [Morella rubra]|uniref:Secreted protein n=1 Tax=Morella rubra TaxID=262757 RepID=A0A6A1WPE3_9ROSI|nr:hypothetical protein CJ030_MR2G024704 [Morella rubra]